MPRRLELFRIASRKKRQNREENGFIAGGNRDFHYF